MSQTRAGQPLFMGPSLVRTKDTFHFKNKERRGESEDGGSNRG